METGVVLNIVWAVVTFVLLSDNFQALRVSGKKECYVCDSFGCGHVFDKHDSSVDTVECDTYCFKSVSGEKITRGCSGKLLFDGDTCTDHPFSNGEYNCYCNSDLCNKGSDIISTTMTSLVLMPTFLTVFLRL